MQLYTLEAHDNDGICMTLKTPISKGNLAELNAELRVDLESGHEPKDLEDKIHSWGHSGCDPDWINQANAIIARFALNARDIGANLIKLTPREC